jgi:Tol biopolymer transport system component
MIGKRTSSALLAAALCLAGFAPAAATEGNSSEALRNGLIAFGRYDPAIDNFSLWVAKSNGTRQKRITEGPANFSDWSPDGRRIAFDFPDGDDVHIGTIARDGTDRRTLTTTPGVQEAPDWSPDGEWITFNALTSFDQDPFTISIWIMRSDGSDARQITQDAVDVEPVFSPDGTQIAFGRIAGDSAEGQLEAIFVVNSDGTGLREVVPPRAGLEHPDWSPDGRSIVFNIAPEHPTDPAAGGILSVQPDGQGLDVLLESTDTLRFFKPAWSPNGRRLLVGCFDTQAGLDRLCTMSKNGKVRVVVDGDTHVNFPSWGPKPKCNR